MSARDWTGSTSVLPESLRNLAQEFIAKSHEARDEFLSEKRTNVAGTLRNLGAYLGDHASTLNEWGDAVEQLYARLDARPRPDCPTNAQGVALAGRFHHDTMSIVVTRGGFGLPDTFLYVVERSRLWNGEHSQFDCGIDEQGRVSS